MPLSYEHTRRYSRARFFQSFDDRWKADSEFENPRPAIVNRSGSRYGPGSMDVPLSFEYYTMELV